jgi:hypothetical protein
MFPRNYYNIPCTQAEYDLIPQWYATGQKAYWSGYPCKTSSANPVYIAARTNGWNDARRQYLADIAAICGE